MFQVNPSESSARQRIHMKNQAIFSSKDKSKKMKCRLLQFLYGALRVNILLCPRVSGLGQYGLMNNSCQSYIFVLFCNLK